MIEKCPESGRGRRGLKPRREPAKIDPPFAKIAKYLAIGLEIPSTIIGGLILGYLIDLHFGTSPWFTLTLAILSFFGAVFRLTQYLKHFTGKKSED